MNRRNGRPATAKTFLPTTPQEFSPMECELARAFAAHLQLGSVVLHSDPPSLEIGASASIMKRMTLREYRSTSGVSYLPAASFEVEVWVPIRAPGEHHGLGGDWSKLTNEGSSLFGSLRECFLRLRLRELAAEVDDQLAAVARALEVSP